MAYTYTPKQYISAAKRRIEREDAVAETALSSYLAMGQAEQAEQLQPVEEKQESSAGFFQRAGETVLDFGKSVFDGLWKAFEGVVDFGASAVGVVAGWAGNNDLKDKISDFVAFDGLNEGLYGGRTDFLQNSFINDMSATGQRIVRGVGQGIGQMLPMIALTVATGGAGAAAAAGGAASGASTAAGLSSTAVKAINLSFLAASAAGGATEQALNDVVYNEDGTQRKVSLDRAFLFGLANGAVEVGTEMLIGDGIYESMFGEGVVNKLVNRLGKSQGFSKAVSFALNAIGEGVEEVASEAVANTLKTIYNSKDGKVHWESPDVQQMFEAGVIGALTAAALNGTSTAIRKASPTMSAQDTAMDISNIERRMETLEAEGNYGDEIRGTLEAEHEANLKKLESIYERASDKQKAKIRASSPIISTLLGEDGKRISTTLADGATAITEEQARTAAMAPSLRTRTNEVANSLSEHGTTLASDMTDVQVENVRKLRTVLKKAGTKLGKGLKVVVAENLAGQNAYISKDYFVISKDQLNNTKTMAEALAHESTHFAEDTNEYEALVKFFEETLSAKEGVKEFLTEDGGTVRAPTLWDQAFVEVEENSTGGGRADGYHISKAVFDALRTGEMPTGLTAEQETQFALELKLARSEIVAKASEYVLGSEEMIDRLVENDRSTARSWLRRIKERIKLIENAFKGDKAANTALKELRKAEKLFSDALAASGERYIRTAVTRREEGEQDSLRENTDSEGRTLTPEQEKFFKDSKIRDNKGRLLTLYHGTSNEFFVFDKSKIQIDNLGRGFYFVDSEKIAESYAERRTQERGGKERVVQSYINAVKPFDVDNVTREQAIEYLSYDYKATNKDASAEEVRAFAEDIVSEEDGAETPDYGSSFSTHEENFQKWLREKGYDALIVSGVDKRTGMEGTAYVVFESNQIKLTNNESPTANDDIRYSLRPTTVKHYTQEEVAQIINGIQANALQVREGNISIAGKKKLRDLLWERMNSTEPGRGKQITVALEVADYIIENAMVQNSDADPVLEEHYATVDALRRYLHGIDLSGIKGEVKSRYGTDNSVYALWSKKGGMKPDVIGQELADQGFQFRSENEAEIFFEIADAYAAASKAIRESSKQHLSKLLTADELADLRQTVARTVLTSFEKHGSSTSLAQAYRRAQSRIMELKELLAESRKYNQRVNAVLDLANRLKPDYVKQHHKSSLLSDPAFTKAITQLSKIKWRSDIRKQGTRKVIAAFAEWYNLDNRLLNGDLDGAAAQELLASNGFCGYLNKDVLAAIEYIKSRVDEKTALSLEEVECAEMILQRAEWLLKNYDKISLRGQQVTLSEVSREANTVADKYSAMHSHNVVAELIKKFQYNTSEPRAVFLSMFGYEEGGAFMEAFRDVADGETRSRAIRLELITKIDEFMREHKNYKKRLAKDKITVAGHEVSVQTAISLYMLSKQKHSIGGLQKGGWGYRNEKGYWVDCGTLTDADIKALASSLSEADMEFTKTLREFFDASGAYMRETDIADHGSSNVQTGKSDYFPIVRYAGDRASSIDQNWMLAISNASIQNMGVTKARVQNDLRLDVQPILSVVEKHAKQIGQYAGLLIPIKNIQRVYNCNVSQVKGKVESIRNTVNEKVWSGFHDYFVKWLADVQGMGKTSSAADRFVNTIRSNFAKFQLGANIKVIFSQAASFPTAFCELSAKSMIRAFGHVASLQNMDKYCAWARVRNAEHGVVLAEGNLEKIGAVGDVFTKPIQLMDRLTIGLIWNACQCEVESRHKGDASYKFGTEANMEEAGKLLEEVGRLTQPNYTETERSAMQRSTNQIAKSFSMFFSVPLKQWSRLIESIGRVRALKYKKNVLHENVTKEEMRAARSGVAKSVTAITVANIIYVLMGQAIKFALNKDRKDKEGNEISVLEDTFRDFISTSVGVVPLMKEVYNIASGFETEEAVTSSINDLAQGVKGLVEMLSKVGDEDPHEAREFARPMRDFIFSVGQVLGLPTRNLYNLAYGVVNRFDESKAYEWNSLFYAQSYTKDLKKAIEEGDESKASTIVGLMMKDDGMTSTSPLVNKKLRELYGKGYAVLPKTVRDGITYEGETIKLSEKSQKAFKDTYSGANKEVENLIKASYFNKLSEEVQAKSIKWIYDYYYESAVCETVGEESNSKKRLFAETMPVSKFAMSIAACSAVEGKVDKKGNTIAGTKKAEVMKLLNKLSLTRAEKALILAYLGYSVDDYAGLIKSYIRRIGLSKAQQKAFLAYCGLS